MLNPLIAASGLMILLAGPAAAPEPPDWADAVAALQQRATVHVPRVTVTTTTTIIMRPAPRPPAFVEKKSEDCFKMERLAGFTVNRFDSVDLLLKDGKLLRAKLAKNCPALGFYRGFYVTPTNDKKLCAKRDFFRSRSGRSCGIEGFTALVPAK